MKRRTSIINTAISLLLTVACVFVSAYLCNVYYKVNGFIVPILFYLLGAVVFGFVNAVMHEVGHVIAYKKNKFYLLTVCIWFFKWTRINKKMRFDFTLIGEEAGYTEGVPMGVDNMEKRYKGTAWGGIIASLIALLLGVGLMFTVGKVDVKVYCVLSMMLPVSAYYLFGNALPMINGGAKNDGAVIICINKKDDSSKVTIALLKAQARLFEG
ncbi:MAG: hypothetical protein SPL13_05345, partial [Clostridia bacterium]|nr:hypothetical protein [Clostridia bacterium]